MLKAGSEQICQEDISMMRWLSVDLFRNIADGEIDLKKESILHSIYIRVNGNLLAFTSNML